jgi:hypothetical protein
MASSSDVIYPNVVPGQIVTDVQIEEMTAGQLSPTTSHGSFGESARTIGRRSVMERFRTIVDHHRKALALMWPTTGSTWQGTARRVAPL